jgi:hypothetical protein
MPQTPNPADATSRRVDAMLAVLKGTDGDRDLDQTPARTTVRPPRPRRVVAFMSASKISSRVGEGVGVPQRTDVSSSG